MIENFQFSAVCLASRQVTSSPRPPCNLHYFTKWGTVYRARATYENQAILFCFAAALHRSSHSTGLPAERTYDVCCRWCMCTRYVLICRYSIPCSTGDHIANRTGVIYLFFGFPGKRIAKRAWSARYLPPSGVHVWLFSLASPFPVRLPEKREKITPVLWDRFIYLFYLFTSFSGHRPAQRECARRGLIGPMQSAIPTQSHNP